MELSVCIDAVFTGIESSEAIKKVKNAGIGAIEFWSWQDKDINEIQQCCKEENIKVAALCTGFISLTDPSKRDEYIESLQETIEVARLLGCHIIISQAGSELPCPREEQHDSMVQGLKSCSPYLVDNNMTLVVEPLNVRVDHKGYYLSSSDEAVEIIRETGSPNVKVLFDIYHQQVTEGDLLRRIREYIPYIGHFHAAGNPGRHELYNSEISYQKIFEEIEKTGYDGYIGLEYFPEDDVFKGLKYAKQVMP